MSTKKWLLGTIGGALLAGAATASAATGQTIEIRLARIDGTLLTAVPAATKDALGNPTATSGVNAVSVADLTAHEFQLDVWGKVYGADSDSSNDGIQSIWGNIAAGKGAITVTPAGASLAADATVKGVGLAPWNDSGSHPGKVQTWGMGSGPSDDAADFVIMRAAGMQTWNWIENPDTGELTAPTQWKGNGAPGAGIEVKLGTFKVKFTQFDAKTDVTYAFGVGANGDVLDKFALFKQDGANLDAKSGVTSFVGYSFDAVVPEPAGLSVLALGALGLLARRRK